MKKGSKKSLGSLELFTGAGGLALGLHEAGFHHRALVEVNDDACGTLLENISKRSIRGISNWKVIGRDIRETNLQDYNGVDIVAGGPPCQPFSIGGKHQGMSDDRNMIPQFIRAVRELQPRAFILENVKGLTRQSFRNYFSYIQLQLTYPSFSQEQSEDWTSHLSRLERVRTGRRSRGLNYNVVSRVLNAADYGVPQTRQRVFIVGFRSDVPAKWSFPSATHSQDALIYDQWVSRAYWDRHEIQAPSVIPPRLLSRIDRVSSQSSSLLKPWRTIRDATSDLPAPTHNRSEDPLGHHFQPGAKVYVGHTGSPIDGPSKTLKAGDHGVPGGENMIAFSDGKVRYLTIREAARVQTFPDSWRFLGAWTEVMRQLGNAVPAKLASVVAKSVAKTLRDHG